MDLLGEALAAAAFAFGAAAFAAAGLLAAVLEVFVGVLFCAEELDLPAGEAVFRAAVPRAVVVEAAVFSFTVEGLV